MAKITPPIIKEFREFIDEPKKVDFDETKAVHIEIKHIERFLLKALATQRADLIREVEEGLPKEMRFDDEENKPPIHLERKVRGWLRYEQGYNQYRREVKEFLKKIK